MCTILPNSGFQLELSPNILPFSINDKTKSNSVLDVNIGQVNASPLIFCTMSEFMIYGDFDIASSIEVLFAVIDNIGDASFIVTIEKRVLAATF